MADLITAAEFKIYAGISATTWDTLIGVLIDSVTAMIENYTGRTWTSGSQTDFLDGGNRELIANTIPIGDVTEILDMFDDGDEVIGDTELVTNGSFASDTGWTKGAGWTIAGDVAVATTATTDLSQASVMELGSRYKLVYTISGLSAGTIAAKLGTTQLTTRSADGTYTETGVCLGNTTLTFDALTTLTADISAVSVKRLDYTFEPATGLIYETPDATTLQLARDNNVNLWQAGKRRYRVTYTGGTDGATDDVKMAAYLAIKDLFDHRDQSIDSESIGDYSYTKKSGSEESGLPSSVKAILAKYRVISI